MAYLKYDAQIIEEIKFRNDIEDVIGSYVTLKKAGSTSKGLCPFHSEKTPSFTVFSETKSFYCFGCGAGGDVISFIMRVENLDYPSAIQFLARRAGINLPEKADNDGMAAKRSRIYDMNRDAARFFYEQLKSSPEALAYIGKRQLSPATVKHFGLGYAPDGFELLNFMRKQGYSDEELITGFLCGRSKKTGNPYPYFRGRLMFPIIDTAGHVIAFGGRIIGEGEPKYLNTSDTPAFSKSRNLYALNYAAKSSSERMILCEGYMDVISLHAAGFTNAVATLGTSITEEQARIMKKYTKKVVISYDSDSAGQRAAERAFRLLADAGLETRILKMEGAKDPDEYIKKFGADKFRAVLDKGISRFDFALSNIMNANDLSSTDGKLAACRAIAGYIAAVPSAVEREIYIAQAAKSLEIEQKSLVSDVNYYIRRNTAEEQKKERQRIYTQASAIGDRVNPDSAKNLRSARAEENILGIILIKNEYIPRIKSGEYGLSAEDFFTEFNRKVFELIIENTDESGKFDTGTFARELNEEEQGRTVRFSVERAGLNNDENVLKACIETLKDSGKEKSLEDIINGKRK